MEGGKGGGQKNRTEGSLMVSPTGFTRQVEPVRCYECILENPKKPDKDNCATENHCSFGCLRWKFGAPEFDLACHNTCGVPPPPPVAKPFLVGAPSGDGG